MGLINSENLIAHMHDLIGGEYRLNTEILSDNGEALCFERELYGRFILGVQVVGIDPAADSVTAKVYLTRLAEPKELYDGLWEWDTLESKVIPEDSIGGKLDTFNALARLCIERPEDGGLLFVWGIKSPDDDTDSDDADLVTKNDIDIVYNIEKDYFSLSIDTDYYFDSDGDQKQYAADLLTELKRFMRSLEINTHVVLSLDEMANYNLYSDFEDLETLYAAARMILLGYSR